MKLLNTCARTLIIKDTARHLIIPTSNKTKIKHNNTVGKPCMASEYLIPNTEAILGKF